MRYGLLEFIDAAGNVRPDAQVADATRAAIRRAYRLRPVGSETLQQLEDRIVAVFTQRYMINWNQWARSPDEIIGDVNFHEVVSEISPLSVRISASPVDPVQRVDNFVQPTPGAVTAPKMDFDGWMAMLRLGWQGYTDSKGRQVALDLMRRQAQGQTLYVPKSAQQRIDTKATNRVWMIVLGGVAVVGVVSLLALYGKE